MIDDKTRIVRASKHSKVENKNIAIITLPL